METKPTAHFIEVDEVLIVQLLAELLCNQGSIELKQTKHVRAHGCIYCYDCICFLSALFIILYSLACSCLFLNELPYFLFKVEN